MADVNWRAPGFVSQTTGNYPDKSDAADKDNIFLTDQGWVYRHYKSLDKSEFWDEIIWAGYVDSALSYNDPVDPINDDNPTFLVGDGFQFVSGAYPATLSTIGTVTVDGASTVDTDHAEAYVASFDGSFSGTATYAWTVKDSGGTDVTADTAVITISGGTTATATITFKAEDDYNVGVVVADQAGAEAAQSGGIEVTAAVAGAVETIDGVTVTGPTNLVETVGKIFTVTYTGTAVEGSTDLALTASPSTGITITAGTRTGKSQTFNVTAADSVAVNTSITLTGSATNADVGGGSAVTGTTTATVKTKIESIAVTTSPTNPAQGVAGQAVAATITTKGTITSPTYAWTVGADDAGGDASKITYADATVEDPTFSVAADCPVGDYTLTLTVGGTGLTSDSTLTGSVTISVGASSTSSTPTTTYTVTVGTKTSAHPYFGTGSSNGFLLDGVEGAAVSVSAGNIIRFNQANSTNAGHPLRLYTDAGKSYPYTTGVTTVGTPGSAGAHTTLVVSASTPTTLYYQCSSHGYMGGTITKS